MKLSVCSSCQEKWIQFDLKKIEELKEDYENTMLFIRRDYGINRLNLNSTNAIKNHFNNHFNIRLNSTKIIELNEILEEMPEEDPRKEHILGIVTFLKIKYAVKNYLICILTHADKDGVVTLRERGLMPNKRQVPYSTDILKCVVGCSDNVTLKKGEQQWA